MKLNDALGNLAGSPKVRIGEIEDDEVIIYVYDIAFLRLYPVTRGAQFFDEDRKDLSAALKKACEYIPQLGDLRDFMHKEGYHII